MRKNVTKPCMSDSDLKKHRNKLFVRYGKKTHGDSKVTEYESSCFFVSINKSFHHLSSFRNPRD